MDKICRHCEKSKVNRPRGLCWSCYYTAGVKEMYPSTSKYARRGVGNFARVAPMPATATKLRPGSAEKLALLSERARLGLSLFHPDDVRFSPALDAASIMGAVDGFENPDDPDLD